MTIEVRPNDTDIFAKGTHTATDIVHFWDGLHAWLPHLAQAALLHARAYGKDGGHLMALDLGGGRQGGPGEATADCMSCGETSMAIRDRTSCARRGTCPPASHHMY
jgi:hypothetical protein